MGIASASALVISNMIGTGIWSTPGILAGQLGSAGMILLVCAVGAVSALADAFCYSGLGMNFPSSGGEDVYLTQLYGPTWGSMFDLFGIVRFKMNNGVATKAGTQGDI